MQEVLEMKCAYCGKEAKGTKEHIISCSVLDLFPECYLTFDEARGLIHRADPIVKDVCAECNNGSFPILTLTPRILLVGTSREDIPKMTRLKSNTTIP